MYPNNYGLTVYRKKNPGKLGIMTDYDYLKNNPSYQGKGVTIQGGMYNRPLPTKYIERDYTFNPWRTYTEVTLEDDVFFNNNRNLFNYKKQLENEYGKIWKPPIKVNYSNYKDKNTYAYKFIYEPDIEHGSYGYKGRLFKTSNNHLGRINQGMPFYNRDFRLNEQNLNEILDCNSIN